MKICNCVRVDPNFKNTKKAMFEYLKHVSQFSIIVRKSN